MQELVWLNGKVLPLAQAKVGLEDRGLNFADGVYEVVRFYRGKPFTLSEHLDRLERSAQAVRLCLPHAKSHLGSEIKRMIEQSALDGGMIYLQLTRGEAPRAHAFPQQTEPNLFFFARALSDPWRPGEGEGCCLMNVDDERWSRCWIKSIALLPNILAKNQALAAGCDEAVFVHEGRVTECSASNLFVVRGGAIHTCPAGAKALAGITRLVVFRAATRLGIPVHEEAFPVGAAMWGDEVFITSTTREINWVRQWEGKTIGDGRCGAITRCLHEEYVRVVRAEIG